MGLQELKNKINKNVKGVHADVLSQSKIANIEEWVPTPHYDLNRILSGSLFKGIPEKTLTMLVGPEASFKSSFMCLSMVNAQQMGYTPVILDTEGAWTGDFVRNWGLDPDNILYVYTPFVDEATTTLGQLIGEDEKFIIGLDSLGNLETEKLQDDITKTKRDDNGEETKGGDGRAKADQGQLQKKIKRLLKIVLSICKRQNSIGLISGHFYGSPNSYGSAEEIGGGKHAKLAPHIIVSLKKSSMTELKKTGLVEGSGPNTKIMGTQIRAITLKNRFYPAFQECTVNIDYMKGINPYSGLEKLAMDSGYIHKGGAWYTNTITEEKVQGTHNVYSLFDEDLLNKLDEYVKETGYSSVNKQMEETLKEADDVVEDNDSDDVFNDSDQIETSTQELSGNGKKPRSIFNK